MRKIENNKKNNPPTRTSRYSDTRPSRYDTLSSRSKQYSATNPDYDEDEYMRQFRNVNPVRVDRANNRKRRKRNRHWLEKVIIALGAISACVIVAFGGLIVISLFIETNEPANTIAYTQDNESNNSGLLHDDANSNDIQSEIYTGYSNSGDEEFDAETTIGVLEEYETTNITDEAVYDGGAADDDIYNIDSSNDNEETFNSGAVDESYAQTEVEIMGGGELVQHTISLDLINNFRQFSFFIESNLDEYAAFHFANPVFCYEYVVWKVNAGLNRDFFENPYTITDPHPFLVNPFNRLPYDFSPRGMQRIDGTDMLATPETIKAFNEFQTYARTHGHDLRVASAYRSISAQRTLYANRGHLGTIARPGHSEHHTGRAIDLWGPLGLLDRWQRYPTSDTALWVADNAYRFGFIVRYTIYNDHITGIVGEPWHITYVTEHVSRTMRNNGYGSLEEFAARNPSFNPFSQ